MCHTRCYTICRARATEVRPPLHSAHVSHKVTRVPYTCHDAAPPGLSIHPSCATHGASRIIRGPQCATDAYSEIASYLTITHRFRVTHDDPPRVAWYHSCHFFSKRKRSKQLPSSNIDTMSANTTANNTPPATADAAAVAAVTTALANPHGPTDDSRPDSVPRDAAVV